MKKKFILLICMIFTLSLFSMNAYAYEDVNSNGLIAQGGEISTFSVDSIIVVHRMYYGRLQYRRWNETKNCWVDPYWIYA